MAGKPRLALTRDEEKALQELKKRLMSAFPVVELVVYGSAARGEATPESDLDVLVVTDRPVSHREKYFMVDVACGVNLEHGSNISLLIVDRESWEAGLLSEMPIREEVARDGVPV